MVLISTNNPLKSYLTGTITENGARLIKVAFDKKNPEMNNEKESSY